MRKLRIGINGFGRIGRAVTRISLQRGSFDIVAVNTHRTKPDMLAYLLKHDSVYHTLNNVVSYDDDHLIIDGREIQATRIANPEEIPWDKAGVDIVLEATGVFTTKQDLEKHLKGDVKRVILTAPSKDDVTPHIVLGVNDKTFDWKNNTVFANASCTTNNSAPMFYLLNKHFGIVSGFLTTIHAYTATQSILDKTNKKKTRSRSAAINIIPTTTGAAKAVVKVIPELKGKIDGMAVRVPVPVGSFTDISAILKKQTTVEEINGVFKEASENEMKGILGYESSPLVSSDYIGNPHSVIFDPNYTKINGSLVKAYGWYDNEWGYSSRLADLVERLAKFI